MKFIITIVNAIKHLFTPRPESLGPKRILTEVIEEIERRKMVGFDDVAISPHNFRIYLSEVDADYLAPLMKTLRSQLLEKVEAYLERSGYKVEAPVTVQIKEDKLLEMNDLVIESDFNVARSGDQLAAPANTASARADQDPELLRRGEPSAPGAASAREPEGRTVVQAARERSTQVKDDTSFVLRVVEGASAGATISLRAGEHTFGRGTVAKFRMDDPEETLSRVHFKITVCHGEAILKDLESKNGTQVNDRLIGGSGIALCHGDMISAGSVVLKVA